MGGASAFLTTQPNPGAAEPSHRRPQLSGGLCPPAQENVFHQSKVKDLVDQKRQFYCCCHGLNLDVKDLSAAKDWDV